MTEEDIEFAAVIFAGIVSCIGSFFAGARLSKCSSIQTPCFQCERQITDASAQV